jgi:plasmid maintenance system antidote protein VapI
VSFVGIASTAGTTSPNIEQLVRNGTGSAGLASTIGTTSSAITNFVNGKASAGIASALGTTTSSAQERAIRLAAMALSV